MCAFRNWFLFVCLGVLCANIIIKGAQGLNKGPDRPINPFNAMHKERLEERLLMVETQIRARGITDVPLLDSLRSVPRHLFVSDSQQESAYTDFPLPIGFNQTISQPYIVALMAKEAELKKTDVILEIGSGCGYASAVFSNLVKKVYALEIIPELAQAAKKRLLDLRYTNIEVINTDGSIGVPEYAPFDAIIVSAGAPVVPANLKKQLALHGRLIIPVGKGSFQELIKIIRLDKDHFQEKSLGGVRFVPLKGKEGWHE